MKIKATYQEYELVFKNSAVTSRGVLKTKQTYFLILTQGDKKGIGECAVFRGLSYDDTPDYEQQLQWLCEHIHLGKVALLVHFKHYPSIQFGIEQAFLSLASDNPYLLFESDFTKGKQGIPINGLIWMGDIAYMKKQIHEKIRQGYKVLKLKVGALDFEKECELLRYIRDRFPIDTITLRLDVNGGFAPEQALYKLQTLAAFKIHSIEQPIVQGQVAFMAKLCRESPIPIALDEELIGVLEREDKYDLLAKIRPLYIVLKPSLVGGIRGAEQWIEVAKDMNIGYWVTSALESNIGLNAIAQWTVHLQMKRRVQGLGTGGLFINNIPVGLCVKNGFLKYKEGFN